MTGGEPPRPGASERPSRLRLLAPAKVNLCLHLGPIRPDGRHELVTVFEALDLADTLTLEFGVARDEVVCPGVSGPNLAAAALAALRRAGWAAPPVRVRIDKQIPVAAGMGGGSSDAAALLARAAHDGAGIDVYAIGRELGADVPALIDPGLCLATGAGDRGLVRGAGIAPHASVVLPAATGLSTAAVFAEADRLGLGRTTQELAMLAAGLADGLRRGSFGPEAVVNDLAPAALSLCPELAERLSALTDAGAEQAIVSGSGPTAVGLWWGERAGEAADAALERLQRRFPAARIALPLSGSSQSRLSR
ncbi:4-(cytidine 5'-diphospho)-2-C-methyl-D-erythritol kinase [Conexibacter sp. DBS9H8]|uniref:4-(cytidine 5'-diphospho)-2-C-methyl-D-erythritol kinase n=1 Tax=Conexibacter sp. DBS9H8 TaxID=2937801 RepID=UPI002010AEDB|nr:hypothetical protein [Conexibacter sp. DBS9H8]